MDFKIQSEVLEVFHSRPSQAIDWGVSLVQAPQIWRYTRGAGIKILVLDTGIETEHPDLAENFREGKNFTTSDASDITDRNGHGTHVAGAIAGVDNNEGIVGVAPDADLYVGKVLGDDGSGSIQGIIEGIEYGIEKRVDIISMSLGADFDPGQRLHDAIIRARKAGIVIVAASGNENNFCGWPAAYEECIAVGAIDQGMEKAAFSNHGEELDVAAPGVDILSTYLNNGYAKLSGTSMATPLVTGVVALVTSYARNNGIVATPTTIVQMIAERSVDVGERGDDDQFGNGIINVYQLIRYYNKGL